MMYLFAFAHGLEQLHSSLTESPALITKFSWAFEYIVLYSVGVKVLSTTPHWLHVAPPPPAIDIVTKLSTFTETDSDTGLSDSSMSPIAENLIKTFLLVV